jgi:formate/nitrite transporter FocA (FNT family)
MRGFITNLVPVTFGNLIRGMGIGALYKHVHVEKEFDED